MADKEFEDSIRDLPPAERIRRLKEYQEKKRKEIEETEKRLKNQKEADEKDIEAAEIKIKEEEDTERQDRILEELEQMDIPETSSVDVESLFGSSESIDDRLEGVRAPEPSGSDVYRLSQEPIENIYNTVVDIQEAVQTSGYMTTQQQQQLDYLNSAIQYKENDIRSGDYSTTTDRIEDVLGSAKSIIKYLRKG